MSGENKTNGYLLLNSRDRNPNEDVVNFRLTGQSYFASGDIDSMAVDSVSFQYAIPNVNIRNNQIIIKVGLSEYTATMPEAFYNIEEFRLALEVTLNSTASTAVFTVDYDDAGGTITDPQRLNKRFKIVSTELFYFVKTNLSNDLAKMAGYTYDEVYELEKIGGYNDIQYTSFIDIISDSLHQYAYINDEDSGAKTTNILVRVIPDVDKLRFTSNGEDDDGGILTRPVNIHFEIINKKWITYLPTRNLAQIDLRLQDEYGDELYNPDKGKQTFNYLITMLTSR